MSRQWVVDASPLILLGKIEQINLLVKLCDDFIIPHGVAQEIAQGSEQDYAKLWLADEGSNWVSKHNFIDPLVSSYGLGSGETQVISYAKIHPNWVAILDDRAARNCALSVKVPVRGTLGILLLAKKARKIVHIKPLLQQLQEAGLRIDKPLWEEVLKLAQE
jgi:predicted nucleic acid-binding protein